MMGNGDGVMQVRDVFIRCFPSKPLANGWTTAAELETRSRHVVIFSHNAAFHGTRGVEGYFMIFEVSM